MSTTVSTRLSTWPAPAPTGETRWEGPPAFIRCSGHKGSRRCENRLCEILAVGIEQGDSWIWDVAVHSFGITDQRGQSVSRQWVTARKLEDGVLEFTDLACGASSRVDLDRVEAIYAERWRPGLHRIDLFVEEL